jgi:nucleoid-associated protein YgaU
MAKERSVYERFGTPTVTGTDVVQRRHTVLAGETLPSIAAYEYPGAGYDSELWRQIAEENDIDDLEDLDTGTTLRIPSPAPSET